jgi:hypothetical protein
MSAYDEKKYIYNYYIRYLRLDSKPGLPEQETVVLNTQSWPSMVHIATVNECRHIYTEGFVKYVIIHIYQTGDVVPLK